MGFPRKLLNEGEELALDLRPHWIFLLGAISALVGASVVDLVVAFLLGWEFASWWRLVVVVVMLLVLLAALGYFLVRYAKWATTHFVVTSERLISGRGVISKDRKEIPLARVNDVSFHQGLFERLLGAGDLTIESAGERGQETFSDVRDPGRVQQEIYAQAKGDQMRQYRAMWQGQAPPTGPAGAPPPPTAPQAPPAGPVAVPPTAPPPTVAPTQPAPGAAPGATSIPDQIEQLADMYRRGLLSQQEYDAKKAELLGRM